MDKKKLKIFIPYKYHHKNEAFLKYYETFFIKVDKLEDADIIFSSCEPFETYKYPNKKFVFGPHFSIFPDQKSLGMEGCQKNSVYLMPSKQALNVWKNNFKFDKIKMVYSPFGVDTFKFNPTSCKKSEVFIYFKRRDPDELKFLEKFLVKLGVKYKLFKYGKYQEDEYKEFLDKSKYGIWLGEHESQGFALEEALSMNVPLLVWSTTLMKQEYKSTKYENVKERMVSAPYWDNRCGEIFYNDYELEEKYNLFIGKIKEYSPRKFVLENLSYEQCKKRFDDILKKELGVGF